MNKSITAEQAKKLGQLSLAMEFKFVLPLFILAAMSLGFMLLGVAYSLPEQYQEVMFVGLFATFVVSFFGWVV